jgi:hypothetical protein
MRFFNNFIFAAALIVALVPCVLGDGDSNGDDIQRVHLKHNVVTSFDSDSRSILGFAVSSSKYLRISLNVQEMSDLFEKAITYSRNKNNTWKDAAHNHGIHIGYACGQVSCSVIEATETIKRSITLKLMRVREILGSLVGLIGTNSDQFLASSVDGFLFKFDDSVQFFLEHEYAKSMLPGDRVHVVIVDMQKLDTLLGDEINIKIGSTAILWIFAVILLTKVFFLW